MENIPTINEPEELKLAYKKMLNSWGVKNFEYDTLEAMEFKLLNEAYDKKFGEKISLFAIKNEPVSKIHKKIRQCLETNKPYEYVEFPDDVIF